MWILLLMVTKENVFCLSLSNCSLDRCSLVIIVAGVSEASKEVTRSSVDLDIVLYYYHSYSEPTHKTLPFHYCWKRLFISCSCGYWNRLLLTQPIFHIIKFRVSISISELQYLFISSSLRFFSSRASILFRRWVSKSISKKGHKISRSNKSKIQKLTK